jgi:hypothetical protein
MIFSHDTHGIQFTWSLSTCGILSWSSQIPSAYETPHSVILSQICAKPQQQQQINTRFLGGVSPEGGWDDSDLASQLG